MHGAERGRNAMETLVRLDYGYSDTKGEPGYPGGHTPGNWREEYEATGEGSVARTDREPRFVEEQRRKAVEHCPGHGRRSEIVCPRYRRGRRRFILTD